MYNLYQNTRTTIASTIFKKTPSLGVKITQNYLQLFLIMLFYFPCGYSLAQGSRIIHFEKRLPLYKTQPITLCAKLNDMTSPYTSACAGRCLCMRLVVRVRVDLCTVSRTTGIQRCDSVCTVGRAV